jgi:tyrosine decarboxylase MnfA
VVLEEVNRLCRGDHHYRGPHVYNSICTEPLPLAAEVADRYRHANLLDNRIFPGLTEAESRVTAMLGGLLGEPDSRGGITSGGTESNLLALLAAVEDFTRRTGRSRSRAEIVLPESAHYSMDKAVAVLGVRAVRARLETGRYTVDVADLASKIGANTAAVVVTAGTSESGAVDDVAGAAEAARRRGVWVHVDAATGGFLIPFLDDPETYPFDFRVEGVRSVTLDPHKYGYAPIPAGYLLLRPDGGDEPLAFASHYRGTLDRFSLLGTRPGWAALAVYACLRGLGFLGYRKAVQELMALRGHLLRSLDGAGFRPAFRPDLTVVGVDVDDPERVVDGLEGQGMIASLSRRHRFLRLVVQRHQTLDDLDALIGRLSELRASSRALP